MMKNVVGNLKTYTFCHTFFAVKNSIIIFTGTQNGGVHKTTKGVDKMLREFIRWLFLLH